VHQPVNDQHAPGPRNAPPPPHIPPPPAYGQARPQFGGPDLRTTFTDIRAGDYARDGFAVLALLISLFMPWNSEFGLVSGGSAGLIIIVVLITLISLASVALPYLARLGMLGTNWRTLPMQMVRLCLNAPYLLMVLGFFGYDIVRGFSMYGNWGQEVVPGLGMAALFGVAGALLAAQPRTAETRPGAGTGWLTAVKLFMFAAVALTVLSTVSSIVFQLTGSGGFGTAPEFLLYLLAWMFLAMAPVITTAAGLVRNYAPWRRTLVVLLPSMLTAAFFLSFGDVASSESFHGFPYYALVLWAAAGAAAAAPVAETETLQWHQGYTWLAALRNGLMLIAIWSLVWIAVAIVSAIILTGEAGEEIAFAVFSVFVGVLAILGARALRPRYTHGSDPRPSREVVLGLCGAIILLTFGRLVAGMVVRDAAVIEPFELIVPMFAVGIATALVVAPPIRELYSDVHLFAGLTTPAPAPQDYAAPPTSPPPAADPADPVAAQPTVVVPTSAALTVVTPTVETTSTAATISLVKREDESITAPPSTPAPAPAPAPASAMPALDPALPAAELFRLAQERPDLRSAIAVHPNVYPGLQQWITEQDTGQANGSQNPTQVLQPEPVVPALDPTLPASELFRLAQERPDLRPAIAVHPNVYPGLQQWIADLDDSGVGAAG